ncbi:LysR family transcriptional regulator [Winogradskya consettensis]|nr:LysR family transcriptional regulator [Actinoplanes consettensis]
MELRQLMYFEAVVRHGSFTRAAAQLHIAQPAVSAQIRLLETELGVTLLTRTTRRIALTAAGELVLSRAKRILGELDGVRDDVAQVGAVLRGRITVGATEVLGTVDLAGALASFHSRHPGIALSLRTGLVAELLGGLDRGEVDLVLAPVHADLADHYTARMLAAEDVVLVTPLGHPAGGLRDEPFVCLPQGSGLRAILDEAAAAAGFEPVVPFEASGPGEIRALVSAGLGVAVMAGSTARSPGPPVRIVPLDPAPAHPAIGLVSRRDQRPSPAASAFRRHLISRCPEPLIRLP